MFHQDRNDIIVVIIVTIRIRFDRKSIQVADVKFIPTQDVGISWQCERASGYFNENII